MLSYEIVTYLTQEFHENEHPMNIRGFNVCLVKDKSNMSSTIVQPSFFR